MKIRLGELRRMIRQAILAEYGASASGSDPTDVKGFYPYEIERGTDVQGYWYRSPGRSMGSDGDPSRPDDAASYIGMTPPTGEEATGTEETGGEEVSLEPTKESFHRRLYAERTCV